MVFDQMHDSMKTPVHCAPMRIRITEILSSRSFLIFCDMKRMVDQLIDTFIFCCRYRHDGDSEQFLELIYPDRAAVFPDLIHHI